MGASTLVLTGSAAAVMSEKGFASLLSAMKLGAFASKLDAMVKDNAVAIFYSTRLSCRLLLAGQEFVVLGSSLLKAMRDAAYLGSSDPRRLAVMTL